MRVVFKCERPDCKYPDYVEDNPIDDNIICSCGKTKWGHHTNVEDVSKRERE